MAHARAQIRDAIASALVAAGTAAAGRVYVERLDPVNVATLPILDVEFRGERQRSDEMQAPVQCLERSMQIVVTSHAATLASLDTLTEQVEAALSVQAASLPARSIRPLATDYQKTGDLNKPVHELAQSFEVMYFTAQATPGLAI